MNSSTRELRRVVWCGLRGLRSQGNWIELQIGTEFLVGLQAADDRGFPFYSLTPVHQLCCVFLIYLEMSEKKRPAK